MNYMEKEFNYIKDQFATYEISLALKELGFNEPCFGYYTPIKPWMISTNPKYNPEPHFIGPNWVNSDNTMYFKYVSNSFGDRSCAFENVFDLSKGGYKNIAVPLWQQIIEFLYLTYRKVISSYPTDKGLCWIINWSTNITYETKEQAILKAIELCKVWKKNQ